jgi:hypothetical protein
MAENSNIDEVVISLERCVDGWDFTRPGADQSLGRDMARLVAERILARSQVHLGPDLTAWDENSTTEPPEGGYKGWKE